jgi:hypothetical protein
MVTHAIAKDVDYPAHLRAVGKRLATASYLVVRISSKLHTDFNVSHEVIVSFYFKAFTIVY